VLLHLSLAWRGAAALGTPDFKVAFAGAFLFALSSLFYGWTLHPAAAAEVSGHRPKSAEV
jgi:hypothetical protein